MGYLTDINLLQQHIAFPVPKPDAPETSEETIAAEAPPETATVAIQTELGL